MRSRQQFNVGAEGSLYLGAALGTAVAVSTASPAYLHIPLALLVAAAVGAAWNLLPAILKAKWKASELVSSLMLNYVGYFLGLYLINYHFRDKQAGYLVSYQLPQTAWLQQFLQGRVCTAGTFLAILCAVLVYWYLYHSKSGYEVAHDGVQ